VHPPDSIAEMLAALESIGGPEVVARIVSEADPAAAQIVKSWPSDLDTATADALGFPRDADFAGVIHQHLADSVPR